MASPRQSATTICPARRARSAGIGARGPPLLVEGPSRRRGPNIASDLGTGLSDAASPRLACGLGRQIAQQRRQTNATRPGLRLQLVTHVVVQSDRNRYAHNALRSYPVSYENVV